MAAVDLGAQSGRVAVGDFDGSRLAIAEVHRFPNVPVRVGETLHWDVLRLYGDTLDGLRGAARGSRLDSVGVDAWAVDFGLLDRKGRLLRNPVHYRDARRAAAFDAVLERIPRRELYDRTGIQLLPINTVFELAAMAAERDPALPAAETLLLIPDLFHSWLCGARVAERTNATTTQCFDPRADGWAVDLLERLGVPTRLLPEIVASCTQLGPLAVDEPRLANASVIAGATHDTASAVAGVPFIDPRRAAFVSAGTWSLVGLEQSAPTVDDESFAVNASNEGGVGGTVRLLRNVTGLWLLHECRSAWAAQGAHFSYDELLSLAAAASTQSLIDPDDSLFAAPGDMPARIGAYCRETAQPEPVAPGEVVRCVLASLALAHARTIELLSAIADVAVEVVHVVGGGARNELLCRWTAGAAGIPVLAGPEEATLVGNLLTQAMALGELDTLADARAVARVSFAPTSYEPEDAAQWQAAHERFADLTNRRNMEVRA